MIKRRDTKQIAVGRVKVGGDAPVSVQSMTNTRTSDVEATVGQINALEKAGCEIVRIAVLTVDDATAIGEIIDKTKIPVISDIHFSSRLALESIKQGVHGLRLNPGNIGNRRKVEKIVEAASERRIPIRIGVNAGSLEREILDKYGFPTPEGMVESALGHVKILEELGFSDIKISLKASDVPTTLDAYRLMSGRRDYPLNSMH